MNAREKSSQSHQLANYKRRRRVETKECGEILIQVKTMKHKTWGTQIMAQIQDANMSAVLEEKDSEEEEDIVDLKMDQLIVLKSLQLHGHRVR